MRIWSYRRAAFGVCAATMLAGCGGSQPLINAPGAMPQTSHISTLRGRMSPDAKKAKTLLYVSVVSGTAGVVDVFSVPKYSLVGQITDGIDWPEGLAIDRKGNLYVANVNSNTVTVYQPGGTSPSLTVSEPGSPRDVAVGSNGYVYVGDRAGDIDVYPPGATSPSRRLTNPNLSYDVGGVAVSSSNNVYADGESSNSCPSYCTPAVVEFANARGSGRNLGLTGLVDEVAGVIVDDNYLIVSDDGGYGSVLIYPLGQTSPSLTITVSNPDHSAINKAENEIYVPTGPYDGVGVYDYPSGTFVTNIPTGAFASGAALSPAPTH